MAIKKVHFNLGTMHAKYRPTKYKTFGLEVLQYSHKLKNTDTYTDRTYFITSTFIAYLSFHGNK